jgi:hypothetical protein
MKSEKTNELNNHQDNVDIPDDDEPVKKKRGELNLKDFKKQLDSNKNI